MAQGQKTTVAKDIATEIENARAELVALEVERAELPARIGQAVRAADAPELVRLRQREREIGVWISSAQIKVDQLRVADLEAQHDVLEPEMAAAEAALPEAEAKFEEARRELEEARHRLARVKSNRLGLREAVRSIRGQIEARLREL